MHSAFVFILFLTQSAWGQLREKFHTTFSVGYVNSKEFNGMSMSSSIDYYFSEKGGIYLVSDFQSFSYTTSNDSYSLEGSVTLLPFTAGVFYEFTETELTPYLLAGGGLSLLNVPKAEIENPIHIKIGSDWLTLPNFQYGLGVKWKKNSSLSPFFETKITHHIGRNLISDQSLLMFSSVIGIRTAFNTGTQ